VSVEDRGQPVEGLHLKLAESDHGGSREGVTGKDGVALFRNVPPGSYSLTVDHDDGVGAAANVQVKRDGPADATVALVWPSVGPVAVRSLNGVVLYESGQPAKVQGAMSVDLLDGFSGRRLRGGRVTGSGAFDFGTVAPGLYFLDLNPSAGALSGLIAVAVDPSAGSDHLELDLGETDCGLFYTDRSKCAHAELKVDQLRGRVVDANGAGIADADIKLFSPAGGGLVEQLQSDEEGNFASPRSAVGTYRLVVSRGGFTPLRETLRIGANSDAAGSFLTVQLGLVGSCTLAGVR